MAFCSTGRAFREMKELFMPYLFILVWNYNLLSLGLVFSCCQHINQIILADLIHEEMNQPDNHKIA